MDHFSSTALCSQKTDNNLKNPSTEFIALDRELASLRSSVLPSKQALINILEVTKLEVPSYNKTEKAVSLMSFAGFRFYFLPVAVVALFLTIGLWSKGDTVLETNDGLAFESTQSELAIVSDLDDVVSSQDLEMVDLEIAMAEI